MDETYIKVKGVWKYLYRIVVAESKSVTFARSNVSIHLLRIGKVEI